MIAIPQACTIDGIQVHPVTEEQLICVLHEWALDLSPKKAYNANVHSMNLAHRNAHFRNSLLGADLVFCDGYGVWLAAKLVSAPLPERMTPPDWIDDFLALMAREGKSIFLLGDEDGVALQCAKDMQRRHPSLAVGGTHHGFLGVDGELNDAVVHAIRNSGASVLFVGMGMPLQELWIDANIDRLGVPLSITVGALFRWYTGVDKRAPRWITDHGLEWLARFVQHPFKHFGRYIIGNPSFFARILIHRCRRMI